MISIEELGRIPLFAKLGQKELEYLSQSVPDIFVSPGEYIFHEGEHNPSLFVIIEGRFELTKTMDGEEQVVAVRVPGTFIAEPTIVLNVPFLASMRATEPSRLIRIVPRVFHTLAASAPELAATLAREAAARIAGLQEIAAERSFAITRIIGPRWQPSVHAVCDFLHRNQIDFEWLAPEDPALESLPLENSLAEGKFPIALLEKGKVLVEPSLRELAENVGLTTSPQHQEYDVVIIGGGPAGISAAVYGAAEGLRTMLIEGEAPGGQAGTSSRIENYLGFPFGVSGDELATRALRQARRLGAEIVVTRSVESIDLASRCVRLLGGDTLKTKAIVLATGVCWRRLAIEGLDRLTGRGVYYGAARTLAGAMQGCDLFLIGAGNSAGQAAVFFSSYARSVTLVVRGESLEKSMSHYLIQQLRSKPNVRVELRSEVVSVHGEEHLSALDIHDRAAGTTRTVDAGGLFIFIGADADTAWLPAEIARDGLGYILTGNAVAESGRWPESRPPFLLETSVPGVFAAGDVRSGSVKRVASAVGDGGLVISFAYQYIEALSCATTAAA
ncbi:cyclic nucleotide-binding domain-containing protein [bacterium]|nr:MAG: cyclic nucleotide-binding domain-containing protein [bacterium]